MVMVGLISLANLQKNLLLKLALLGVLLYISYYVLFCPCDVLLSCHLYQFGGAMVVLLLAVVFLNWFSISS